MRPAPMPSTSWRSPSASSRTPSRRHCPPWLVDRIFRNLLVDVTGNTHRAEFCIDKLYSPDSATGRLGLLELRAFEMPPHARMSLAQQLLVRALVAWFWREPYDEQPIRWGTRLHDRFLLPYFVEQDFARRDRGSAARGLSARSRHGLRRTSSFAFRSTGASATTASRSNCARPSSPGTCWARSRARAARRATWIPRWSACRCGCAAWSSERYVVACNGRRLPLQPTGTHGEFVCGVRYRAWQPPRCLHPTIPVHAPLVFDVVDRGAGALHRRLHLSRGASRRAQLRHLPGKLE